VLLGYVRPFRVVLVVGAVLSPATSAPGLALPLVLANAGIGALGSFLLARTAESVVLVARRRLSAGFVGAGCWMHCRRSFTAGWQ
jgi:ATP-binding cassette subfamily C protein